MNSWKVILATLVIFGSGVVVGGLLVSYSVHANLVGTRPAPTPAPAQQQALTPWMQRQRELMRRMDRDLDLTPQQRKEIEKMIEESAERTRKLWEPIASQMNHEMQRLHRDIRDVLSPDQRKKFEALARLRLNQQNRRGTNQPPGLDTNSVSTNAAPATP